MAFQFYKNDLTKSIVIVAVVQNVESIMEKGENAGYQQFLLLDTIFSKVFFNSQERQKSLL